MDAAGERLGAGRLDRGEAVGQRRRQDFHHLAVAVVRAFQPAPHALQTGRQWPILERRTVPERAGLPGEYRHVMPGIVDRLAAAEAARMLADHGAVLTDNDAVGISLDLDRPADGARGDRVLVVVEPRQAGLRDRGLRRVEPVEWTTDRHQLRTLRLEGLPDRAVGQLGVPVRL